MAVTDQNQSNSQKTTKANPKIIGRIVNSRENPGSVAELRQLLQQTQADFARLFPISVRSLATLESGATPTEPIARRLVELRRLTLALGEVIRKESLGTWLKTPNAAFDGLKPLEVIERGETDRLWSMIYFLRSGVPG